ncbi:MULTISPECIES: hypothetical protein [Nocardiaceae]|uniref:Integral membrane protein n=1 Tax=Rhodococcoides corynebacterioides TaxID=53972 RepID=A0ABS2KXD2_9NOCA|nr:MULTISPECIES: hypothetical protein [Rhodococcus]MBM7416572.1 hypothetical protein [Rhodococcus corynebacterioides]MBP1114825.1 hypothetical protein [Rhodococcus sp. PvP016]
MVLPVIVACEIGFWVAIAAGLTLRYGARRPRAGAVVLACAPVVDLVLLCATVIDLRSGSTATWHHALAAAYIGFSIAYGHRMIRWADVRVAHHFRGGPAPVRLHGAAYARACWADVVRTLIAVAVTVGLLAGLVALVGSPERTEALTAFMPAPLVVLAVDVVAAITYTVWPRQPRRRDEKRELSSAASRVS